MTRFQNRVLGREKMFTTKVRVLTWVLMAISGIALVLIATYVPDNREGIPLMLPFIAIIFAGALVEIQFTRHH